MEDDLVNGGNSYVDVVKEYASKENSKVKVWIVPTNEELVIARDTKDIVEKL